MDDAGNAAKKGDAKIAGRVEEVTDPEIVATANPDASSDPSHLFPADVTEVSVVTIGEPRDHLVIESWHEGRGVERRHRR